MLRASDDTREHTVDVLRSGLLSGRLGTETFVERVDAAYQAKTHDELERITDDLPQRRRLWQTVIARLKAAPAELAPISVVELRPPKMLEGECRVLGRSPTCDYAIADPSVSARHAELRRVRDGWLLVDLKSRNGTRVNGWLVKEQQLQTGDTLTLGASVFVFSPPSPA